MDNRTHKTFGDNMAEQEHNKTKTVNRQEDTEGRTKNEKPGKLERLITLIANLSIMALMVWLAYIHYLMLN